LTGLAVAAPSAKVEAAATPGAAAEAAAAEFAAATAAAVLVPKRSRVRVGLNEDCPLPVGEVVFQKVRPGEKLKLAGGVPV